MKRKVTKVGPASLCVSLPSQWARQNNIEKGDELDVHLQRKSISFSTHTKRKEGKEIKIDINGFDRSLLDRHMTVLYRNNYDKIVLTYKKKTINHRKKEYDIQKYISTLRDRFIGVEILSQTARRTELSCFMLKELQNAATIERRIYFLLKETTSNLLASIGPLFEEFDKAIYGHHDNIVKFINYYLRTIDKMDMDEQAKKQLFAFYVVIDKCVDKLRHLSSAIHKNGCTPRVRRLIERTFCLFFKLFDSYYKGTFEQNLVEERYLIRDQLEGKFSLKELRVLKELDVFLTTINDFAETTIVKAL